MTPRNIDLAEKVQKICPIMVVQVHGSDECVLRKAEYYRDSDIKEIITTMLKLAEFAEYCLDQCSWDNEPDGGSIQDKAEELGFLELRPIDSEDSIDDETEHYFCKWTPRATRKGDGDE